MQPSLKAYKYSLLMVFHNAVFICQRTSVKLTSLRGLACVPTGLTSDMLTNDCRRWARRALQPLVTIPQPVRADPVNALGSHQSHPERDWPSLRDPAEAAAQAGLIGLFFISNHLRSLKKIAGNLDTQIIVHLLLLGWLPEWIRAMNWLD